MKGGSPVRVRLKDIAQLTGVSITTVSLVLNNKPIRIAGAKRTEIIETAKKLNYTVNNAARTLVTQKSLVLGLIVPDIENMFFSKIAGKLGELCIENNYVLLNLISNDSLETDLLLLDLLTARQVDGIFFCPSSGSLDSVELLEKIKHLATPIVLVDRYFDDPAINKVYFDNKSGSYDAVDYLIRMGHQKIAIIAPPQENRFRNSRLEGYLTAIKDNNFPIDDSLIYFGDYKFNSGFEIAADIINSEATAVLSCNDMMTLGFLKGLYELNKKVPADISVVSYDNILDDYTFGIEVTSVLQDTTILAREAFKVYQDHIKTKKVKEKILKTELIIRSSVMDLNADLPTVLPIAEHWF